MKIAQHVKEARKDAIERLLRERRAAKQAAPTIAEIAEHLSVSAAAAARYVDQMERVGTIRVGRSNGRVLARSIVLNDWTPGEGI